MMHAIPNLSDLGLLLKNSAILLFASSPGIENNATFQILNCVLCWKCEYSLFVLKPSRRSVQHRKINICGNMDYVKIEINNTCALLIVLLLVNKYLF